ncbi:MAG: MmgE/PrpD family protein, partial [Acetobacteraceae bacterium]|nr:MmgE/PrpD family protein [Acetobacteraceae bacterium]
MDSLPAHLGAATGRPISSRLGEFAEALPADAIPSDVVEQAKRHMLDSLGIALASSGFEFGQRTAAAVRGLAGEGTHPVIGTAMRLPLRDAVLVNGSLIHGLDYDDTHSDAVVHASASAVPVALHMAREHKASGREALAAYILGVEASARIGAAAQGGFHQVGFHPTGMVGAFGCALTAGRLAGATAAQIAAAQGILLSMAAGSLEFLADGSWTKRVHPGWAGVCAITATALARGGFKAPPRAYEGRFGLFNSHLQEKAPADLSRCADGLGEVWEMRNVALKPYPACHFNHAFVDAALALRARHGLRAEDIARITCRIHDGQVKVVCEPEAAKKAPANSYDAQFSVHYAVCAALVHGRFTLDELEEEAIRDPRVLALCQRTGYEHDPASRFPRYYSGELVVETKDGRALRHREEFNRGSDANPLSSADVERKFMDNARRVVSAARARRVLDLVM